MYGCGAPFMHSGGWDLRLGGGRHRERIGPIACRMWILVFESGKVGRSGWSIAEQHIISGSRRPVISL